MSNEVFPSTYEGWKHCITELCGIPLTKEYVEERISVFSNENSEEYKRFLKRYGNDWTQKVSGYFQQALKSL